MSEERLEENKIQDKKKKRFWMILLLLFLAGFIICGIWTCVGYYQRIQAEKALQDIVTEVNKNTEPSKETDITVPETETIPEETEAVSDPLSDMGIEIPEKNLDFQALQEEVSKDIYAWLYIPDTTIDFPIVQHGEDDLYYLDYNLDGSKGLPGGIFTESINSKDFSDPQTVIYGHNVKAAFSPLHKFEDSKYFEEHPYIYVYTEDKTYVYQIFGAYKFPLIHLIYNYAVNEEVRFQEYLDGVRDTKDMNANFQKEVATTGKDKILTLSTCVKNEKNMRYLVQGVLLNP